jgi:uncharacterized membrane protein
MFQFKNETNQNVYLAFAYPIPPYSSPLIWMSQGWWYIEPDSTTTVLGEKLNSRYYYYYAYQEDGTGEWKGDTEFYVSHLAFKLKRDCIDTYDAKLFKKIDRCICNNTNKMSMLFAVVFVFFFIAVSALNSSINVMLINYFKIL